MAATKGEISRWLDTLYSDESLTHMVVVCDTFDWSDFPVFVSKDQNVHEVVAFHAAHEMEKVTEVYSRALSKESQLAERRALHYA